MGEKLKLRTCLDEREIGDGLINWLVDRERVNQGMAKLTVRAMVAAWKELPEIQPDWTWLQLPRYPRQRTWKPSPEPNSMQ